jgi:hypothetical protein
MLIVWERTDSLKRYLSINEEEGEVWEDQEVDGRINF